MAHSAPSPYLTHTFPSTAVQAVHFCPFDDLLGVGHSAGFTSLIVPGAGEPNFDSLEADPFEGKRRRREREVNSLLDKIPFDMITLDQELVGKLAKEITGKVEEDVERIGYKEVPFKQKTRFDRLKAEGKNMVEEDESDQSDDDDDADGDARARRKEAKIDKSDAKKRARGRNSTLKKMLRKRKRNVVDPQTVRSSPWPFPFSDYCKDPPNTNVLNSCQVAIKEKLAKQRKATATAKTNVMLARSAASGTAGALDRFSIGK